MAYDPEARKQSNSALIIGLIALLIVGGAALAYFATRGSGPETGPTTVINPVREKETVVVTETAIPPAPGTNTVIVAPPVDTNPDTVIVNPAPATSTTTTTTTRNAEPAPREPVANPPAEKPNNTTVNNTIINPPAPSGSASKPKPTAPPTATPVPTIAPDSATGNAAGY